MEKIEGLLTLFGSFTCINVLMKWILFYSPFRLLTHFSLRFLSKLSSLRSISSGIWGNASLANNISSYNRHISYLWPQSLVYVTKQLLKMSITYVIHSAISLWYMFIWKNTWKWLRNKKYTVLIWMLFTSSSFIKNILYILAK